MRTWVYDHQKRHSILKRISRVRFSARWSNPPERLRNKHQIPDKIRTRKIWWSHFHESSSAQGTIGTGTACDTIEPWDRNPATGGWKKCAPSADAWPKSRAASIDTTSVRLFTWASHISSDENSRSNYGNAMFSKRYEFVSICKYFRSRRSYFENNN